MHLSPSEAALQYSSMDNGRYHSDMHSDTEHRRYEQDMSVHDVDRHLPRPPHMPSSEVKKPNESRPSRSSRQRAAIACMYCRRRKVRCTGFDESESGRCTNCQRLFQACVFTPKSTNREASAPLYALWKGRGSARERHAQHEMTSEAQSHMHVMRGHPPPGYTERSHGQGHAHYQHSHRPEKSSYIDFGAPMHHQMQPSSHHHSAPQTWHPTGGNNNTSMQHHSHAEYRHRTPLEPLRQAQPVQRPDWSAYYQHDEYSQHRVRTPAAMSPLPRSGGPRMEYGHQPHRLSVPSPHDYQNMWPQNNASVSPRSEGSTVQTNHHSGMLPVMEPSYDTSTLRPMRTDIYPPPYERVKISDLVSVDEKNDGHFA